MTIRTRFAPSPTGHLHVGSLRTALFNYLFAKQNKGVFVLRIEDTDRERIVPGAVENIMYTLSSFGLTPDEGPLPQKIAGLYGPYVQSRRLEIYKKYSQKLISEGKAYRCFCAPRRLEEVRKRQQADGVPPRYDGHCRDLSSADIEKQSANDAPYVIRQKMPIAGTTEFNDLIHGLLHFRNDLLDDSILIKSDGYPVYNFANVIDDHLMAVTHVIRGEEFLSSTPKHVILYRAFGWEPPKFAHLPLILDAKRQKLSKRSGDVAVEEYVNKSYLKGALLNFIALLGWNPKTTREIFSLEELVGEFRLEQVNKSGAIFDIAKLDFINREWQKKIYQVEVFEKVRVDDAAKLERMDPLFTRAYQITNGSLGLSVDKNFFAAIWPQILERIKGPSELDTRLPEFYFYFQTPEYKPELLIWKKMSLEDVKKNLGMMKEFLSSLTETEFAKNKLEAAIKDFLRSRGVALGEALWPLRVALSGQKDSPSPFEILEVLAKCTRQEISERIDKGIEKCR